MARVPRGLSVQLGMKETARMRRYATSLAALAVIVLSALGGDWPTVWP